MMSKSRPERLVIVGGCAAGMSAASKAKRRNPALEVIALEKTPHVSYSACGIPYYVADLVRDPTELITITPERFREERGIDVRTLHEVVEVRPVPRRIVVVDLQGDREISLSYDKLVIAVGGTPMRPQIPGIDLRGVFTVQTLQDGIRIRRFVDERRPAGVAIIGGGYIAMEMAEAFRRRLIEVVVIERASRVLPNFEPEISECVAEELRNNQVQLLPHVRVTALQGNGAGEVTGIELSDGEVLKVDGVLIATGLAPNTSLAEGAGLRLGNTGGIAVNWKMQSSVPTIYAAGDCVEVKHLVSGKGDFIPLGPTANKQGRVAGENLGGGYATFRGVVGTAVFKTFELEIARTGLSEAEARAHGFAVEKVVIEEKTRAGYYPGARSMRVVVVFDRRSRRLLGGQMVGVEGVSKRIDILAAALANKMTVDEAAYMDLSYAPPFAPVWDPVLVALQVARGRLARK